MYALINGRIFTGEKTIFNRTLVIDGKKIKEIVKSEDLDTLYPNIEKKDIDGNLIAPAFIDLQLNGCGGVLLNEDVSVNTFKVMNETNIRYGCTLYTPTLITCADHKIESALQVMEEIEDLESLGVLGLHIEGPYISVDKKGTHREDLIRVLSDEIIGKISKSKTTILTLAPENAKPEHIKTLREGGVNVALGHTNATYEEIMEKKPYGITLATHLYNAMSPFTHREPGVVGAVFDSKDIKAGIIVDGFHCHYASVRIAKELLGERLYLVTDAASPAGTDMPEFMFEGKRCFHKDGQLRNEEGNLAGSVLTMDQGVRNLVEHVGVSLEEALRMASLYPAKAVNIDNRYGRIAAGYTADLVILDEKIELIDVIVRGVSKFSVN
ncbi:MULTISPECIES: N-acetylglucosamine-6-phosphate deacetylase [Psychrilyobacter]|uniref:N-acetylglucosamine-6-phosphate deacetylase n=1 Tax=Psychrilyobacter piezotolerans TaxID=2293438 RepID=A0ABX9KL56_9FUSO|nr:MULTISPECIES: N-acetylglucosamine-6-phosphate deacetylase [Psychrilyobacter]MCS5423026.1 N-acetylglucosamine-6-phosphate deacetylase [Psychrilyobacter sp. S5]NDI76517.1 N-acetylglucosamine-6-phosphate deacetylase [Psychrilyobacter piezotolerans]RDE66108.1 N-acetylglucosamine-6-phosphate deacetylase [Psychrilyobacter sp. S5]REI43286.1 N-acetylglucosamine-6-phosphate deacetylase [Psychrilyobacter piezotolerans]